MSIRYSSKIIKASALIDDTLLLLSVYNPSISQKENLTKIQNENILVKTSRSRRDDVLAILKNRYLSDNDLASALHILVKFQIPHQILYPILFFLTVQSDLLIQDILVEYVYKRKCSGAESVTTSEIARVIQQYINEGKTITPWSSETITLAAKHFLALIRDFGILEGRAKKHFAPFIIPNASFAFLSLYLQKKGLIGQHLMNTDEWKILFLEKELVERFFIDCENDGLLIYNAAWPVIRIDYPVQSLTEYAHVIVNRAN